MKNKAYIKEVEKIMAAFVFSFFSMVGMFFGIIMALNGAKNFGWQFWVGGLLAIICAPIMATFFELFSQKIIDNKKFNK